MLDNFVRGDDVYLWADRYDLFGYDHEFTLVWLVLAQVYF